MANDPQEKLTPREPIHKLIKPVQPKSLEDPGIATLS